MAMTFQDLPYEMVVRIFSYLSKKDIAFQVQHVCQEWRLAARDRSLWKNWKFRPTGNKSEDEESWQKENDQKFPAVSFDVPDFLTGPYNLNYSDEEYPDINIVNGKHYRDELDEISW